jgi:MinD superfamily P-loop ATPase
MIISVASGKGGTGKTTVATNMAMSLDKEVQLLDCDVEEPNSYLFIKPEFEKIEKVYTIVPEVDESKCTLCGKCGEICQFKAIVQIGETVLTFHALCHSCGGCMEVCPEGAIKETRRELGIIEKGSRNGLEFIHGKLRIGEAMSPPLIRKVREFTLRDKLTIIDAPPGTSCPVINSMKGADFVLLVTEPTPFGLHDLELAFEAVKMLNIPCGLIINRSDIGDSQVKKFAERKSLTIMMEIPFDRKIAEAYSKGELLIECMHEWRKKFKKLYLDVQEMLK